MNEFLTFDDRLLVGLTAVAMRWEERDGFLSDDDLLDIAIEWTPGWDYEADDLAEEIVAERDILLEALYGVLASEEA